MEVKYVFSLLADMLFPPRCVFCGKPVYNRAVICGACAEKTPVSYAMRRMKAGETGKTVSCLTPYRYEGPVRESLLHFKFDGYREHAPYYGRKIAEQLQAEGGFGLELVTAVPLSRRRLKARGYNQAELLAREAAQCLLLPYIETLGKVKENGIQHDLPKGARAENVHGVYRALVQTSLRGKAVLLVDDIVTTGATLCACTEVLLQAGAACVVCAAVAAVP